MVTKSAYSDSVMGHYLTNVKCDNCEESALFSFHSPSQSGIGWFGGCGSFVCTGLKNLLIYDKDGAYLG